MKEKIQNPKFTIITVVYNDVKHIEETIKSVISQTYKNFEYIVIDGGSNDGTVDVIKKYQNKIDYWVSEPDRGIYHAMNKGIKKSKGDFLCFINSNDYLYDKDVLKKIADKNLEYKEPVILYGRHFMRYGDPFKKDGVPIQIPTGKILGSGGSLCHQATLVNSQTFEVLGCFCERYKISADYDFFCRAFLGDIKFLRIDNVISIYTAGGLSSNLSLSYKEHGEIVKKHFGRVGFLKFWLHRKKLMVEDFAKKCLLFLGLKKLLSKLIEINNRGTIVG